MKLFWSVAAFTLVLALQSGPQIPIDGTPPGVTRFYSDEHLTVEVGFSVVGCDYSRADYGDTGPYSSFEPLVCS
ncbi:Uncharacterised protein [Brevundimonas vancanneytii]|uniref:Uncharacterized protein n=1 Tax=Brevundimonas vancanneytii TaxID=1325724 RepID=A0A4P1KJL6_9CAUL|nr:Uncharacterised protein [Brevundimonas vancanneytii]